VSAEADTMCGAGYRERSNERVNSRNGYRSRDWDTRVGSVELAIPKLHSVSYLPDWLLQRGRRAEQRLDAGVNTISIADRSCSLVRPGIIGVLGSVENCTRA
jgi:transposase-like protein